MLLLLLGAGTGIPGPDGRGRAGGADSRLSLGGLGDATLHRSGGAATGRDGGGAADSRIGAGGVSANGLGSAGGDDE